MVKFVSGGVADSLMTKLDYLVHVLGFDKDDAQQFIDNFEDEMPDDDELAAAGIDPITGLPIQEVDPITGLPIEEVQPGEEGAEEGDGGFPGGVGDEEEDGEGGEPDEEEEQSRFGQKA